MFLQPQLLKLTHLCLGQSCRSPPKRPAECEGSGSITDLGLRSFLPYNESDHIFKIKELSITYSEVTDRYMTALGANLPLEVADFTGCPVTNVGAVNLKTQRPNCTVLID